MLKRHILLVEDQDSLRFAIREYIVSQGYRVSDVPGSKAAAKVYTEDPPDAAILDYSLADGNGIEVLKDLKATDPTIPVIVLTGHGTIDLAVQAIKAGAQQFLTKPVELSALAIILRRALEQRQFRKKTELESRHPSIDPFLGTSTAIQTLKEQAYKLASSDSPLLLQGETGTGKTVFARWLHDHGKRQHEPFVDLNCAGFARELLETELFGHEKGAFTGAFNSKPGLFEVANGGTVFLDEIGDMDQVMQPKLLKVLDEKRFRRVGDIKDKTVDVRLIAATHQSLLTLVEHGRFRSDLYFRISTLPIKLVALRERAEDIPALVSHFLQNITTELGRHVTLTKAAAAALQSYSWPGNIRELRNVLERAVLMCEGTEINLHDLRFDPAIAPPATSSDSVLTLADMERHHIEAILKSEKGHVAMAAEKLGIPRSTLYTKLKQYNIRVA